MRLNLPCCLLVGLSGAIPALAQQPASLPSITISLGLSGGVGIPFTPISPTRLEIGGISKIRTDAEADFLSGTAKEAYSVNLFLRLAHGKWFLQPEAGYQSLLSSPVAYEDDYPTGMAPNFAGPEQLHNFRSDQLMLGTLAGYYLGSEPHFYLLTGPATGFRIGGSDYGSSRTDLGEEIRNSLNRAPETTRFFIQGGLGYGGLARHLNLEARFIYGLTPLVRNLTFRNEKYALKAQAHILLLTMAFTLDVKSKVASQ